MKFFKSILAVAVLLSATSSMLPRITQKKAVAKVQPKSTQSVQTKETLMAEASQPTYSELLAKVRNMAPAQVVSGSTLQPTFVKSIVDNSSLSRPEVEALLQAGINMHSTWSGNNEENKVKLSSLTLQITNNAQQVKANDVADALGRIQMQAQNFYNPTTNLLNAAYLQKRIQGLLVYTDKRIARLDSLRVELFSTILTEWKKRGINERIFKNKLNDQITEAYNNTLKSMQQVKLAPQDLGQGRIDTQYIAPISEQLAKRKLEMQSSLLLPNKKQAQEQLLKELGGEEDEEDFENYNK